MWLFLPVQRLEINTKPSAGFWNLSLWDRHHLIIFLTGGLFSDTAIKPPKLAQWSYHQGFNKPFSLGSKSHSRPREEHLLSVLPKPVPCLHQRKICVSYSAQETLPTSQTCCWASVLGPGVLPQGWCHKVDISHHPAGTGFLWHGGDWWPTSDGQVCLTLWSWGTALATIYGHLPINKWAFWPQIALPIWMNNRGVSACECKGSEVLCWEAFLLSYSSIAPSRGLCRGRGGYLYPLGPYHLDPTEDLLW